MNVSPHLHTESALTGSTLSTFIKRAKDLGRIYFSYTDHNHLSAALKAYGQAKKSGLKPILGIEFYFKDPNCPLVVGTKADKAKYFSATIYAEDQEAYQEISKVVSRTDFSTFMLYEEKQNLWTWADLEYLSKFKTNIVLSGVHCMVSKPMLAQEPKVGELVLKKLISLFPERVFSAILCESWTKKYEQVVEILYKDGTKDSLLSSDLITTNRAKRIKASDLIDRTGHFKILSKTVSNTYYAINKEISEVKLHKGFLPYPGGDVTLKTNRFLKALSARYNLPILATDYAYYSTIDDKIVQTMKLEGQNKLHSNLHMKTSEEMLSYLTKILGMNDPDAKLILNNNNIWASRFDNFELKYNWRLAENDENALSKAMDIIKKNGRMKWNDQKYIDRLKEELQVIAKNGRKDLTGYFLPIIDVLSHYKENNRLTGPGRGSAAGSLFSYLLGITHVNPFDYDLSFARFYSMDRILSNKLADIDSDLESRELLVGKDGKSGYLYGKYGNRAAQIGTRHTLRLKSTIKDTNRYFNGSVESEIEALTKSLPDAPQGVSDTNFVFGFEDDEGHHVPGLVDVSDTLQNYIKKRPKEWDIVIKALGITRAHSSHASAFVISDVPVSSLAPTKNGNITQYEAKEAEEAGLIKYDLLVVTQLQDIRKCIDLINKKNNESHETGHFTHKGSKTYVWDLPKDADSFKSVWNGSTETCFQINTKSMIPYVKEILPQSIEDLGLVLSLVRPGPLDYVDPNTGRNMAEEYVHRRKGGNYNDIEILNELIPETLSILVYQEQITKIAKQVAGFDGSEAEQLRENIGKKKKEEVEKTKPRFVSGAVASGKVNQKEAEELWARIETSGRYSFNKSHAIAYSFVTYACMFLKYHYPLEWWAAILSNASENEITSTLWPYVKDMILPPDINLSTDEMVVDYTNNKIRSKIGVIRGLGDKTIDPIVTGRPYENIQDFVNKNVAGNSLAHKLIHVGVLDSLFPVGKNFLEKIKMYQDAVEVQSFIKKTEKAKKENRKTRLLQPKEGKIPELYANLDKTPMLDAAMRKAVLPSLPIDFYRLGSKHSKVLAPYYSKPCVVSKKDHKTILVTGEHLKRMDAIEEDVLKEDMYFAATCYVNEVKEFMYPKANPTKRALKLVLDADNYVSEKVLWPDYNTGDLIYPLSLKKGSIVTVFFKKRAGKKDLQITEIILET